MWVRNCFLAELYRHSFTFLELQNIYFCIIVTLHMFRSEGLAVPKEPRAKGLGWSVTSNSEPSEGKTSSQTRKPGWKGTTTTVIVTFWSFLALYQPTPECFRPANCQNLLAASRGTPVC